jgi:uncharacterized protein DUF3108
MTMSIGASTTATIVVRGFLSLALAIVSARMNAQAQSAVPFGAGERLTFVVSTPHGGKIGDAVMSLTGPTDVRGRATLLASFDTRIRVALMNGSNESKSWIDPKDMTSLRFTKHEHRPFSSNDDSVEVFPDRHHWEGAHGASGDLTSDHPLDELSFIYFLRTLSFAPDSTYSFSRHYDTRRSPTTVRIVKQETLTTLAGVFRTVELEMRVKDGTDYKGEGVIHIWLSGDSCHLPVRMESNMPLLGTAVLTLDTVTGASCLVEPAPRTHRLEK